MTELLSSSPGPGRSVDGIRGGPGKFNGGCWGRLRFIDAPTGAQFPIPVHYAVPEGFHAHSPILFVMPGIARDGAGYLSVWAPHAARAGALLLVPEFPGAAFPRSRGYNLGNMFDECGRPVDRLRWSFSVLERLFDHIRAEVGSARHDYLIYGHSAGGQFVVRLLMFVPESRVERAVAANAGWYTLPNFEDRFPYGLRGHDLSRDALKRALERPLTVLIGEHDTEERQAILRTTPEAARQGRNRVERGRNFLEVATRAATSLGADLAWRLAVVPGVGHANRDIANAAASALFDHAGQINVRPFLASTTSEPCGN